MNCGTAVFFLPLTHCHIGEVSLIKGVYQNAAAQTCAGRVDPDPGLLSTHFDRRSYLLIYKREDIVSKNCSMRTGLEGFGLQGLNSGTSQSNLDRISLLGLGGNGMKTGLEGFGLQGLNSGTSQSDLDRISLLGLGGSGMKTGLEGFGLQGIGGGDDNGAIV